MGFFEVLLLGVALAMDACAIAMTNGMCNAKIGVKGAAKIGLFFGFFQFLMPVIGFFIAGVFASAFMDTVQKVSSWVSFLLLGFLGGKMIFECIKEWRDRKNGVAEADVCDVQGLTTGKLFLQAIATSIDALAVGVTLQMAIISKGLLLGVWGSCAVIGVATFILSVGAVYIGKMVGNKLADKASFFGGLVLLAIGIKLLIEGML